MCPYSSTEDGFEIQMGTNHLGTYALTGHLMPLLKATSNSRVVVTSSIAHKQGNIDFSDLNWKKRNYKTSKAYGDSKIANLYFTYKLAEILREDTDAPTITAAHPGWTRSGDYFGPSGFAEMNGYPVKVKSNALSHNTESANKLWDLSEELTGVKYL